MPAKARIMDIQKGQKSTEINSNNEARILSSITLSYFPASLGASPM